MGQQDLKIHELVAKIERGDIRLPEMQRRYVWQKTRVRDLLDSLYRGYPSGTILTWETDEGVATRDFAVEQATDVKTFQLLLDGQQRLSSLAAIILGKPLHIGGRVRPIDILFNLDHPDELEFITEVNEDDDTDGDDTEDAEVADASEDDLLARFSKMAFVVYTKKLAALPQWVSATEVFKEPSDKPFLKAAGVTDMNDPRYDKYTDRLKQLRGIKDYQYRVHILDRDKSYEEVTEIFVRVNSLGAKLRSSDLALAQITAKWRDSLKIFQAFQDDCKKVGFDLGLGIHLKTLVSFITGQSRFRAVSNLSKERLEQGWEDAKKGMDFALNFLRSNVKIDSPALLSSPFLIITLAYFGHARNYHLSRQEAAQLRYWALVANAKARYSRGSSETFLDQDIAAIKKDMGIPGLLQLLKTQVGRLDVQAPDLENRNSRSAYFKTMFLAFRDGEARDWRDQLIISLKHRGSTHTLQFHHIFPWAVLKKLSVSSNKINDICNMAFIGGGTNRKIRDKEPSDYLPEIVTKLGASALDAQSIPTDPQFWQVNRYDEFLAQRRERVAARLNDYLGHSSMESVE
ncbi:MAG: DUF262 domain-containing protein [Magnetospirillum sp.]|nr:DUF262 domain-containing protein [Magnetospirillum sp.]